MSRSSMLARRRSGTRPARYGAMVPYRTRGRFTWQDTMDAYNDGYGHGKRQADHDANLEFTRGMIVGTEVANEVVGSEVVEAYRRGLVDGAQRMPTFDEQVAGAYLRGFEDGRRH